MKIINFPKRDDSFIIQIYFESILVEWKRKEQINTQKQEPQHKVQHHVYASIGTYVVPIDDLSRKNKRHFSER